MKIKALFLFLSLFCNFSLAKTADELAEEARGILFKEENFFKEEKLKQAFELFQKACEAGSGKACYGLAYEFYRYGIKKIGVEPDPDKVMSLYHKACKLNYADACSPLGYHYKDNGDTAKAKEFFKKACSLRKQEKCREIEDLEEEAKIVAMSYEQLNNACKAGMSRACYRKEDIDKAKLYEQNCQKDGSYSCFVLAEFYAKGKGVAKDLKQAENFFEKSCNAGYLKACSQLAFYKYEKNKDYKKALDTYQNGCDMNEGLACFYLGDLYKDGKGVEKNLEQAIKFYEKSCSLEESSGCFSWAN